MQDLRAHVDKLTEIFDKVRPCNDDCELAAILAWVDPEDRQRVAELRNRREAMADAVIDALRSYAETHTLGAPFDLVLIRLNEYDHKYRPERFSAPLSGQSK
jgi:hypothetical protein